MKKFWGHLDCVTFWGRKQTTKLIGGRKPRYKLTSDCCFISSEQFFNYIHEKKKFTTIKLEGM